MQGASAGSGDQSPMKTEHEINAAINAAEPVLNPLAADNAPVSLTNKTVLALIDGAKGNIDKVSELEDQLEAVRNALR